MTCKYFQYLVELWCFMIAVTLGNIVEFKPNLVWCIVSLLSSLCLNRNFHSCLLELWSIECKICQFLVFKKKIMQIFNFQLSSIVILSIRSQAMLTIILFLSHLSELVLVFLLFCVMLLLYIYLSISNMPSPTIQWAGICRVSSLLYSVHIGMWTPFSSFFLCLQSSSFPSSPPHPFSFPLW